MPSFFKLLVDGLSYPISQYCSIICQFLDPITIFYTQGYVKSSHVGLLYPKLGSTMVVQLAIYFLASYLQIILL